MTTFERSPGTFGAWLDNYDGPSGPIAQLSAFWRDAGTTQDPDLRRPRVHAVDGVSAWLLAHAPEQLHAVVREAIRAYKAIRAGESEPVPSDPVTAPPAGHQQPDPAADGPLAPGPAMMAALGRIEAKLDALIQVTGLWGPEEGPLTRVEPDGEVPAASVQVTGSLWREIAVPEPNWAAMAADGDPGEAADG